MTGESITSKTVRTSIWGGIEKLLTIGAQFVISILLARLLVPSDYGIVAMLSVFIAISEQFVSCGFSNALISKTDCKSVDYSTAFYFNFIVSLIFYFLLYLAAPWIANFYNLDILSSVLRVSGLILPLSALRLVQSTILSKFLKAKKSASVNIAASIVSGIVGIVYAYHGFGVWSLVAQQLSRSIIIVLILWISAGWYPKLEFSMSSMAYLWNFGSKMLVTGIISSLYGNLYSILIGKFYNKNMLGIFNNGQKLATFYPDVITGVLSGNSLPIMAQIKSDKKRTIQVYRQFVKLSCFISIPVIFLIALFAAPFVHVFLTEKWMESVVFIQIFAISSILSPANSINLNILQVYCRTDYTLKAEIIKKTIGILVVFLLLQYGVLVLAVGYGCINLMVYIVNLYYANKVTGLDYWSQISDILSILLSSLGGLIIAYFISILIDDNLLKMLVGTIVAIFVYYYLTRYIFKMDVYNHLRDELKTKVRNI